MDTEINVENLKAIGEQKTREKRAAAIEKRIDTLRTRLKNSKTFGHLEFEFKVTNYNNNGNVVARVRLDIEICSSASGRITVRIGDSKFDISEIEAIDASTFKQAKDLEVGDVFICGGSIERLDVPITAVKKETFKFSGGEKKLVGATHYINVNGTSLGCSPEFECQEHVIDPDFGNSFYFGTNARIALDVLLGREISKEQKKSLQKGGLWKLTN